MDAFFWPGVRCYHCSPGCSFLSELDTALQRWYGIHPNRQPPAPHIAQDLGYSRDWFRDLRVRHGLGHSWLLVLRRWQARYGSRRRLR
jgi:hypothetical protein